MNIPANASDNTLSPEQIDGRLNAYRRLFVSLMTHMAGNAEGRQVIEAMMRDTETVADAEEDPGVVAGEGFAAQQIADDEIRAVLRSALTRADATDAARRSLQP